MFWLLFEKRTNVFKETISMAWCKTAVTPLLTHWSYFSLALNHRLVPPSSYVILSPGILRLVNLTVWSQVNRSGAAWCGHLPPDCLAQNITIRQTNHLLHGVYMCFNTLEPRSNYRHFADDIFKCIFVNSMASQTNCNWRVCSAAC